MLPLFNFWGSSKVQGKHSWRNSILLLSVTNSSDNNFTESETKKKESEMKKKSKTKQPDKLLQDYKSLAEDGSKVYTDKSNQLR